MRVGSLFSGIGGFDEGFVRAGMDISWQCESDPQCLSVLRHRYPGTPTTEDVRDVTAPIEPVELVCGGFPCQDLSVAGRRAGLAGEQSGLFHQFMRIVAECSPSPRYVVIENVPGLLSSNEGRDMGIVLGALEELGYGWAYRCLDSQFFGVPQRRRRIFIVGYFGDWRPAAKILFESESVRGNTAPRRKTGESVAPTISSRTKGGGGLGTDTEVDGGLVPAISSKWAKGSGGPAGDECQNLVSHPLRAEGFDASEDGTGRGTPLVTHNIVGPLCADGGTERKHGAGGLTSIQHMLSGYIQPVAFAQNQRGEVRTSETSPQLTTGGGKPGQGYPAVAYRVHGEHSTAMRGKGVARVADPVDVSRSLDSCGGYATNQGGNVVLQKDGRHADVYEAEPAHPMQVRRLVPRETERLQGFPDDWTRWGSIENSVAKEIADGPRYKMLGNAVTVQVAEWIGRRIMEAEQGKL